MDEEVKEEYSFRKDKSLNRSARCMPFINLEEDKQ
jgi:hypothetical protein